MPVTKPRIITTYKLTKHTKLWGKYSPTYIVVHFTGGFSAKSDTLGGMLSCYKSFLSAGSNAHYLVGRDSIWEMVNPKVFYCTYSCGSGVGRKNACVIPGWGPSTYAGPLSMSHAAIAGHTNTINIEVCSCKTGKKRCDPMDDGWYFNESTYWNTVNLCAWLCEEFGIRVENIIMHNQVTGKICPAMWCNRKGAEEGFTAFKDNVSKVLNAEINAKPVETAQAPTAVTAPIQESQSSEVAVSNNVGAPTGGVITVPSDSLFYSRPTTEAPIVYQEQEGGSKYDYTLREGSFYYTDNGWVQLDLV